MYLLFSVMFLFNHFTRTMSVPVELELENIDPVADVQIVSGTNSKSSEKMVVPLNPGNPYILFNYPVPNWRASAYLMSESGNDALKGVVLFHQWSPNHFVRVTVNISGLSAGKHALHIHTFGDISQGCKSTGSHLASNFVGNIEAKDDGSVRVSFFSAFLTMFGYRGIVGRSVVIHANPIDSNRHPDVFSSPVLVVPINEVPHQSEESTSGSSLACGVITITDNNEAKSLSMNK